MRAIVAASVPATPMRPSGSSWLLLNPFEANANAKAAGVIVMTVSLDLSTADAGENTAIEALKECASDSRFRKNPADPSQAAKLYWNATGSGLSDTFREIADELSNLRIVS